MLNPKQIMMNYFNNGKKVAYTVIIIMKLLLVILVCLFIVASPLSINHEDLDFLHLSQAEASNISWKNVPVAEINDLEKHVDHVIRSLLKQLKDYNLTNVQIDGDDLKNFMFNYTNDSNNTISIQGTIDDSVIKFKTPQGAQICYKVTTRKTFSGREYNVTSVTEKYLDTKESLNSFSRKSSFVSLTYVS